MPIQKKYLMNEPDGKNYIIKNMDYLHIHTCGVSNFSEGVFLKKNGNVDYMINLITSGSLHYNTNNDSLNNTTFAPVGTVVIYKPNEPVCFSKMEKNLTRYWIHFIGFGVPELLEKCQLSAKRFHHINNIKSIESIFLKIFSEMNSDSKCKQIKLNAYFMDLISEISRSLDNEVSKKSDIEKSLSPALKIMNTKYNTDIFLDDLAEKCHMSKYHFLRTFKQYTGTTPNSYLTKIRLNVAKDLLVNTNIKISSIAESIGIPDQNYFSKIFKKAENITPHAYRVKGIFDSENQN